MSTQQQVSLHQRLWFRWYQIWSWSWSSGRGPQSFSWNAQIDEQWLNPFDPGCQGPQTPRMTIGQQSSAGVLSVLFWRFRRKLLLNLRLCFIFLFCLCQEYWLWRYFWSWSTFTWLMFFFIMASLVKESFQSSQNNPLHHLQNQSCECFHSQIICCFQSLG